MHRVLRSAGSFREYHDRALAGTAEALHLLEDARWKPDRQALDLEVRIGEYYGVVRVSRREFQCLLLERSTLERWVEGVLPPADPFRKHRRGRYVGCT